MQRRIHIAIGAIAWVASVPVVQAQTGSGGGRALHLTCGAGATSESTALASTMRYSGERGFGFSALPTASETGVCSSDKPFALDVKLPEGNYDVTLTLGSDSRATETTVKAESRRLMLENVKTARGEWITRKFTVNVRTPAITGSDSVRLKAREVGSGTWDDRLNIEFNGAHPSVRDIRIEPAGNVTTLYLAGNSTVVDQTAEPWAAWGQMLPRFFKPGKVVVANHAESGETLMSFIGERRLPKVLNTIKKGDYLFIEFAHNDQKAGGNYLEPFTTYQDYLLHYINVARRRGATPVLVTSMHRRNFDANGAIVNTLGDYPEAVRKLAAKEHVALVDLNAMSKKFYEALGPDRSKKAFVHYAAGTYPGQTAELKDDTHFNNYGAYELARMVVEGIKRAKLPIARELVADAKPFDPARPDDPNTFAFSASPFSAAQASLASTSAPAPRPVVAREQAAIPLWSGGAPGALGNAPEDQPVITPYLPPAGRANGTAVLVFPGGGYQHLSMVKEGSDVANWLASNGITAFVLRYRLGPRYHHPVELGDAQRAIRTVRSRAAEWGVDTSRIGIIGFSAGGHLASTAGTHFDGGNSSSSDVVERAGSRPDFMLLLYPVISVRSDSLTHKGSRLNLLGDNPSAELVQLLSNDLQTTRSTPPTFLVHSTDDRTVPVENSLMFYQALRNNGVKTEMHVFEYGGHGFGLAPTDPVLGTWTALCESWLKRHGWIKPTSGQ